MKKGKCEIRPHLQSVAVGAVVVDESWQNGDLTLGGLAHVQSLPDGV